MFKNAWTEKVEEQRLEIEALRATVRIRENVIDAMKIALKTREKLIEDTIINLVEEKKANLNWQAFAHKACAELKMWREFAGKEGEIEP